MVSQFLSKTCSPWETYKYPSTTNLNVEKHQVQVSFTSSAQDVLSHQFLDSSPTVDNLFLAKTSFITFVIIYKWRFWTLSPTNVQNFTFDTVFFFFPHPVTEPGNIHINCVRIYIQYSYHSTIYKPAEITNINSRKLARFIIS